MDGIRGRLAVASMAVGHVLRNPDIRRLEAGWTLGIAADWSLLVAILIAAWDLGGAAAVGLFGLVRMLPSTAVALFMPVPRRLTRDRLIVAINAVRAGGAIVAGIALATGAPAWILFTAGAAVATAGALVRPSQTDLLPTLARTPEELIAANVASSMGEGLGTLGGPIAGAVLIATVGSPATAAIAGVAFGVAALAVAGIRVHAVARRRAGPTERQTAADRAVAGLPVAEGLRAFAAQPAVGVLIGAFGAQLFVRGLLSTLLVVAAIDLLGLGEPGVGWLNAAVGAGGLVGSLAALGLAGSRRLAPGIALALTAWGLPIALIGLVPVTWFALAALAVVGIANAMLDVAGFTQVQRTVPAGARPGVLAILEGLAGLTVASGAVAAPMLVTAFGVREALGISGAILPVAAVLTWPWIHRLDARAVVHESEIGLLRQVSLFRLLPLDATERLAAVLEPRFLAAGEVLMREGEPGDDFYIVEAGGLDVLQGGRQLRRVGPGEGVGEIALLRAVPRTATVRAATASRLYRVAADAFVDAVTGHPHSEAAAQRLVTDRLGSGTGRGEG